MNSDASVSPHSHSCFVRVVDTKEIPEKEVPLNSVTQWSLSHLYFLEEKRLLNGQGSGATKQNCESINRL